MKPIRLELTGLNSYTDKQIIDFEKLTERGLFGIFGNTGSGKSTILDAITIAMYGDIARNTKEYINSECDKAIITYEFEIGSKNAKRRYIVDRTIIRSETGTKTSHARLVEIHNDKTQVVLSDKVGDINDKITQVVGLTANDFTRSVVLPQGKFNDFLQLTGSERRDMLERIFNLEKYGRILIDKVRRRKNTQIQRLRDINSKLSQYDGISVDLHDNTVKELEQLKVMEKKKISELEYEQKKYEEFKIIYEEQIKIEKIEARKKELDLRRNDIVDKTKQLENSINAEKIHPYIDSVQNLEKDIADGDIKIVNIDKKINILGQELSITKIKSEESYNLRNEKLPKLSEEKGKLERARVQEIELTSLDKELKEIKEKGNILSKEKDTFEVTLKDNEYKRDVLEKHIKEIEHKAKKLIISADLKQKIYLAYDYEKQYTKLSDEKKVISDKLGLLSKEFNEISLKSKYILRDKEVISKKLNEENSKMDLLLKKCPGKNEDILLKTEQLIELKSRAEIAKENEIKKEKIQNELNIILEQKHSTDRELNIVQDKLQSNKKNTIDLEKEVERLKYLNIALELKKELKENMPCPVCGSRHHENLVSEKNEDRLNFEKSKLEKLHKEEAEIKNKIETLNARNSGIVSIEKIKNKEMDEIKYKLGEIKSSELSKKYEEEQRKLEVLKNSVRRWEKDNLENEENISKYKEEKNNIEKEEIKIEEGINSYKKTISDIKESLEHVSLKYKEVKEQYVGLKSITRTPNLEGKVLEINKNEKIIEELNREYSNISKEKDELEISIRDTQSKLHQIDLELISAREVYTEKRKARDEKYNEVISITKGELPQNLLNNIEIEINKIVTHEQLTKKKLEEQRVEYDKHIAEKNNVEGRLNIAKDQYKLQSAILEQLLRESRFDGIYSVKRSLLDPDYKRRLGEEITEYEEEQKILTFKYKELIDKLNGRRVKNEDFENLKNNMYNLKVEIGNIGKKVGAKQSKIGTLKDSLEKIKELSKQLNNIQHKVDLLEDLDKIIQGNRFVEYVATNQLKYIAFEASKHLEIITNRRYALEIDSTLNFVMRDNLNGGLRRSVDTLSGGETFLTSLSLALALSSQIQLKGSAPLEFFFLDEGFGSLDRDLLEIVMQSLERLQSDKLSVGIISHVEELKNRVPVKLIVVPSEAGSGSKVKIEYS